MSNPSQHGTPTDAYRLFFPLGIVLGVAGASIWPAYQLGLTSTYSGRSHAFVQAEGFLYAFVAGFLLTAIPRFTGTPAPGRSAQLAFAALLVLASACFEIRSFVIGHLAFAAAHLTLIVLAAGRFLRRQQQPPDTFALVGTGIACGAVAAFINAAVALEAIDPRWDLLGRRLLTEGMVLLLVLGVGGFLGPRLLGFAQMPLGKIADQGPRRRMGLYVAIGVALALTVVFEYGSDLPELAYLRAAIGSAVLLVTVTPWRAPAARTTLSWCVWTASWLVILALWLAAIVPSHRVDFLHVLFMGGFTLLILAVGTRVTLSHGGHGLAAEQRSWPLRIGMATGLVAVVTRVGAGFAQESFFEYLAWAAAFWIAGVAIWGLQLVRLILGSGGRR
ncbi:MAG TPA: NnrS family protein [Vicinamibacteria bacterium]|nr:NnrS family protein [Vicinamibacteria bacterium]